MCCCRWLPRWGVTGESGSKRHCFASGTACPPFAYCGIATANCPGSRWNGFVRRWPRQSAYRAPRRLKKRPTQSWRMRFTLVDHVQKFLIELGAGFAFVGRQVPLSVGDEDDYLDLLFYHLKLRCFVVIDLKMKKFTPADAGQMNYYLSAVDSLMKHSTDAPSIGLILCKSRDRVKAEYALRDISKPIGVAEWQTKLVQSLPEPLRSNLPTIEQIEEELGGVE